MSAVLMYAAKSALVLALLYPPYVLLLHRESFFRFNRLVLLGILGLSLLLPLCNVPWLSMDNRPVVHAAQMQMIEIGIPVEVSADAAPRPAAGFSLFALLGGIYIIGVAALLVLRLWQVGRLCSTLGRGSLWIQQEDGVTIHCRAGEVAPYSWMNHVVISERDYADAAREILLHEKGHIRARHSWDLLLLALAEAVQWWNPLVYMLGGSLRDVHEYEADDYVLRRPVSASAYQMLLIKKAVGSASYTFANNFNHSLTKKRITMMRQPKSNPWMRARVLYVIPVAALALSAFATPEFVTPKNGEVPKTEAKGTAKIPNRQTEKKPEPLKTAHKPPQFIGGQEKMMQFLSKNVKYPTLAQQQGVQGRVLVNFVVEADGSLSEVKGEFQKAKYATPSRPDVPETDNAKVKETQEEAKKQLVAEAVRVVKLMQKQFQPGEEKDGTRVRCQMTMPIMFRLN